MRFKVYKQINLRDFCPLVFGFSVCRTSTEPVHVGPGFCGSGAGVVEHLFGEREVLDTSFGTLSISGRAFDGRNLRLPWRNWRNEAGWNSFSVPGFYLWTTVIDKSGQATKGVWWMPWHREATKDVAACDKLREAGKRASIRRFLNAETRSRSIGIILR